MKLKCCSLGWTDAPIGWDTIVELAADPDGWATYGRPEGPAAIIPSSLANLIEPRYHPNPGRHLIGPNVLFDGQDENQGNGS